MTNEEINELLTKGQIDGATLYRVADALYKVTITFNWIIAVCGVIAMLVLGMNGNVGVALGVLFITIMFCFFGYAAAVFCSHGAKVIVHLLFTNLAILGMETK